MDNDRTPAAPTTPDTATTQAVGPLTVTVWPDTPLGEHQRYAYRITDTTGQTVQGRDLFTGAGQPVDPSRALRDLASYLSAAGEARQYTLDHPGHESEHQGLFPDWLAETARLNPDALALLAENPPGEPDPPATEPAAPDESRPAPRRWISVVFLQGTEADEVLDLIDRDCTDAAIEHLAGYDFGEETVQAALENGYVYDSPPTGTSDRVATRDVYTLSYNPPFAYVGLSREYDALPDPALLGIDTPTPIPPAPSTPAATSGTQRTASEKAGRDWFAPPPGPTSRSRAPGRGPSL